MGFLLVLVAPAFLLAGGLWNRLGGVKARTELRVGQGTCTFKHLGSGGTYVLPGFQVRLERFEASRRSPEVRLLVGSPQASLPLKEGQRGELPDGFTFQVERLIPEALEFGLQAGAPPVPPSSAQDPDVLLVLLGLGRTEPVLGVLHAFGGDSGRREEPMGRFAVLFRERLEPGWLESLRSRPPRAENLEAAFAGRIQRIPARAGGRLEIAGASLRVVAVYPDFQVRKDGAGNPVAASRSAKPLDPWLEAELVRPGSPPRRVLLSARQPEYTDRLNAPNLPEGLVLRYVREAEETQARFVVFSRAERKVALVESGRISQEGPWVLDRPFVVEPGLSVTPVGLFEGFYPAPAGLSPIPGRAAVRLKVTDSRTGGSERAWLRAGGRPSAFFGGRVALGCLQAPPDPKAIRSTLVVADPQGRELARKVVGVSDALVFEGLSFLQSPQGSGDPEASAILVVDRPGSWVAWLGLLLFTGGALWMLTQRGRKRSPGPEDAC